MKMNRQSRSFVKQVQIDLLALSDAPLFHTVQQWMDGSNGSRLSLERAEETCSVLGYTRVLAETKTLPHLCDEIPEMNNEGSAYWLAPSPHHLRALLTAMDEHVFARHVIALAFQALHTTYPEWYEGITFNAHLANYLRQMKRQITIEGRNT